jgi:hypothetical protein
MVSLLAWGLSTATNSTPESISVCNESEIARQPVELGNNQLGPLSLADSQCLLQFGPLVALTALDLGELADQRPGATVQVVVDSRVVGVGTCATAVRSN